MQQILVQLYKKAEFILYNKTFQFSKQIRCHIMEGNKHCQLSTFNNHMQPLILEPCAVWQ